ncbi:hypothetical protein ZWY2020_001266 [Hordeum vulgare]|nr:hypothetical protein ZWY2020_001266 [Hordeum vulgare]
MRVGPATIWEGYYQSRHGFCDAWGRSSSTSSSAVAVVARRLQSRYDLYMGFDDADAGGNEVEACGAEAYNCPFCGFDFDFIGLCCHINDEHAVEAKSRVCRLAVSSTSPSCDSLRRVPFEP